MKIIVVGDKDISKRCSQWLLDAGEDVSHFFEGHSMLDDHTFAEWVKSISPDIIFSIQAKRIFRKEVIEISPKGIVNLHFSLLPKNRGMYPVAWTLLEGDHFGGVTLHYIDEGIDSGDIIAQKRLAINPDWTAYNLWSRYNAMGFELFKEWYQSIKQGDALARKQNDLLATYHDRKSIDFTKTKIDWYQPTKTLYNWMRALIFPSYPCPSFNLGSARFEVLECGVYPSGDPGIPGSVMFLLDGRIVVNTLDGSIVIMKMRNGGGDVYPIDLREKWGMKTGMVLDQ